MNHIIRENQVTNREKKKGGTDRGYVVKSLSIELNLYSLKDLKKKKNRNRIYQRWIEHPQRQRRAHVYK